MAESYPESAHQLVDKLRGKKDEEAETAKLKKDDIYEIEIKLTQNSETISPEQKHNCDICMIKTVLTISSYLCYICNLYLCKKCFKKHDKTHRFVNRKAMESTRQGNAASLIFGMREDNKVKKDESMDGEKVEVIGRVNVKHELDKRDCLINGFSGLGNTRWVAVDINNYCIKIFCSASNTLLRYIKFGSEPRDVTEIKQTSTDSESASDSKTDISVAARGPDNRHCLGVTFPNIKQICFIDVNKIPAVKAKTIQMDKMCWSIEFSEDKILTLCGEHVESKHIRSIYILSAEGVQLKVIQNPDITDNFISDLTVYEGRVYLSSTYRDQLFCINMEDGKTLYQLTLEWSGPTGISVDHNSGVLYLCGPGHHKVYKLSPDSRQYEPLSLDTVYTESPWMLCFRNNKLYLSHNRWAPTLRNIVDVVHLLT